MSWTWSALYKLAKEVGQALSWDNIFNGSVWTEAAVAVWLSITKSHFGRSVPGPGATRHSRHGIIYYPSALRNLSDLIRIGMGFLGCTTVALHNTQSSTHGAATQLIWIPPLSLSIGSVQHESNMRVRSLEVEHRAEKRTRIRLPHIVTQGDCQGTRVIHMTTTIFQRLVTRLRLPCRCGRVPVITYYKRSWRPLLVG